MFDIIHTTFQMYLLERKIYILIRISQSCTRGTNSWQISLSSVNGLAPYMRQAITWSNGGLTHWGIYVSHHEASFVLTQWGRVTHIWDRKIITIVSDNGLSPGWGQAVIWTSAGILLIGSKLQLNFDWNLYIFIHENAFENVVCKMASISSRTQ